MGKKKLFNIVLVSSLVLICVLAIGRYSYIYEESIERGEVIKKESVDNKFYVFVQPEGKEEEKKLLMKDKTAWNLVHEGAIYGVEYSWYGFKEPTIEKMDPKERE